MSSAQPDQHDRIAALERQVARLKAELVTDELTRLMNRRGLMEQLETIAHEVAYQFSHPEKRRTLIIKHLSVIFIDIDNFKQVNTDYGHGGGDQALSRIGQVIRRRLRAIDIVGRYGGEEIVVGLVGANLQSAKQIAEDLRANIEQTEIHSSSDSFHVTISCGVASLEPDMSIETLLAQADEALYRAKHSGRNKVVSYRPQRS